MFPLLVMVFSSWSRLSRTAFCCLGSRSCRVFLLAYFQVGKLRPYSYVPFLSLFSRYFEFVWLVCSYFGSEHLKLLYGYVVWTRMRICCRKQWRDLWISPKRVNLAQTLLREWSPRRPAHEFWASEYLAQARGVSLKRDPAWFSWCLLEPSHRRRGLAWASMSRLSETPQPERGAGRGSAMW